MVLVVVGKVEVPLSAHYRCFEHYSPQPNPNKICIMLFKLAITS